MKIVFIHHYYKNREASGENIVVDKHISALREAGHQIHVISRRSDEYLNSWKSIFKVGFTWALNLGANPKSLINAIQPDMIIVHNLYPGFSSSWIKQISFPVILWLHNYRNFCIAATFFRNDSPCTICAKNISLKSLFYRCGSKSIPQGLVEYSRLKFRRSLGETNCATKYVCLSERSKEFFRLTRINIDDVSTIPNFVSETSKTGITRNNKWIYVGRLTPEKGILSLLQVFPSTVNLDVYGDGPLSEKLESLSRDKTNISFKGSVDHEMLESVLQDYTGAFVPSLWSEGIPTTFLEFCASGIPVIAYHKNSAADYVLNNDTGKVLYKFEMNEVESLVHQIVLKRDFYSQNAKRLWATEFTKEVWVRRVEALIQNTTSELK